MSHFKKILVAVDLDPSADQVLKQAIELASESDAKVIVLSVAYSAGPMYGGFMGEGAYVPNNPLVDETDVSRDMREKLQVWSNKLGLLDATTVVEFGRTIDVILDVASREEVDLIVLGSHGRHGVGLLLGSTTNGVLHRAKCDVLAVRIKG